MTTTPQTGTDWTRIRHACPACGAAACSPFAIVRQVEAVRCNGCRVVYVRAMQPGAAPQEGSEAPDAFTGIYDERYFDKYLRHSGYARRVWRDRARARLMGRFHAKGRLLDVGCSIGHFVEAAGLEGWEACGVEPSAFAAQFACKRGLDVRQGVLEDSGFPDGHFGAVSMWHVLEHVPDLQGNLAEVKRILAPGGLLAVLTPNVEHPMARFHGPRWKHIHQEHLQLFSHRTLPPFLERMGFETVLCRWLYRHSEVMVFAKRRR